MIIVNTSNKSIKIEQKIGSISMCDVYVRLMVFSTSHGTMGAADSSIAIDLSTSISTVLIIKINSKIILEIK